MTHVDEPPDAPADHEVPFDLAADVIALAAPRRPDGGNRRRAGRADHAQRRPRHPGAGGKPQHRQSVLSGRIGRTARLGALLRSGHRERRYAGRAGCTAIRAVAQQSGPARQHGLVSRPADPLARQHAVRHDLPARLQGECVFGALHPARRGIPRPDRDAVATDPRATDRRTRTPARRAAGRELPPAKGSRDGGRERQVELSRPRATTCASPSTR